MVFHQIIVIFVIFTNNIFPCYGQNWHDRRPLISLKQGLLEGTTVYTDSSKIVYSFLGIPYALPPIGNLRFAPPRKHYGWNGTYQAVNFQSKCPQLPRNIRLFNEDCLYLNIWTPANKGNYAYLPVVVFFEGIDFYRSSQLPISGQDLAAEGLVIVTVNYRLNIFGFFCLGSNEARGNLGLLDQYISLIWIRENIQEFGGDPKKLTVFGHSSGAVSVALHMVSPKARNAGLFQRAIISSGSALAPWHAKNDPIVATREVLRLIGCTTYVRNILECIRSKEVEHILQVLEEYSKSNEWTDMFLPVIDTFLPEKERYLPEDPLKVLRDGTYLQVPILTGITKPIANPQFNDWRDLASQGYLKLQQYLERVKIPELIRLYRFPSVSKDNIFDLIKWKYASLEDGDVRALFEQLKQLEFDAKIQAPHYFQLSQLISSYVLPIFVYYLDDVGLAVDSTDNFATTDLLLLFGPMMLKQAGRRRFNSNELRLSNNLKEMWTNFILFGSPTPNPNSRNSNNWRKYTMEDPYVETFNTVQGYQNDVARKRTESILFWNQLLPKIANSKNSLSNNIPRELQNSPDPAAGFRHAMYTLVALVIALLALLLICIVLLKKRTKERDRHLHLSY